MAWVSAHEVADEYSLPISEAMIDYLLPSNIVANESVKMYNLPILAAVFRIIRIEEYRKTIGLGRNCPDYPCKYTQ
jgi:hypothetical protein